jgi:leucyl/phenylalanyl-tRNA--protein transferase
MKRKDQEGTWITDEMESAYNRLHELGMAHSAEAWEGDQLVGGVYGVICGGVLFGESMFGRVANASRFAFYNWVLALREKGVALVDCQVYSPHLEQWGARHIDRTRFQYLLSQYWENPGLQKRVPR